MCRFLAATRSPLLFLSLVLCLQTAAGLTAATASPANLPSGLVGEIDETVARILEETGAPSTSIAVVQGGEVVLTKAYGLARLDPDIAVTPAMRYPIGSISKQFVAVAVVMLAEEGKLDLDAPIASYFPQVTRAEEITLRQLLSHTAGIRDYWPQDYVPPAMLEPITTGELIDHHARQPLDFEPGTRWQYSNTGYVIAGAIVEKVVGKSLMEFLAERVFRPLDMDSIFDIDRGPLPVDDAAGYQRFALGPLRPAPKEGAGWLFAAGQLAMTAEDLAKWNRFLLSDDGPGARLLHQISQEVVLADGVGAGYGLGVGVELEGSRRRIRHGGEVSGFTARSVLYPEEGLAVVALVNQDAVGTAGRIADKLASMLFVGDSAADAEMRQRAKEVLLALRRGKIERSMFTPNGNAYFSETALADIASSLEELGELETLEQDARSLRGGLITRVYKAAFQEEEMEIVTRSTPEGKFEQFTLSVD